MRPIARTLIVLSATMLPAVGALGPLPAAFAATITPTVFSDGITNDGNCTLREAIRSANLDVPFDECTPGVDADTIVLSPGTYELTVETDDEEDAFQGDLDVTEDLTITGPGAATTIIDGAWPADPDRIFDVHDAGTDLALGGVTIRDGDAASAGGGGLRSAMDTSVSITDALFTGNTGVNGGAIQNNDDITLARTSVADNSSAGSGGGIYNNGGVMTLTDVAVAGNSAGSDGGGMYSGRSVMTNVVVSGNTATGEGGGLELDTDNTLTNVTVSGNSANLDGGGIQYDGTTHILNSVTVAGNTADADANGSGQGGGINIYETTTATVDNTIVAGNTDRGGEAPDCFVDATETLTSGGNNLIGTTAGCTFTASTGDLLNVDPKLGPLADHGGFTMTRALLPGSPAIDAAGPDAPTTDQRGLPRNPDIGAYELVQCAKVPVNRIGTSGNDALTGTDGADGFLAQGGNDTVKGLGGDDAACLGDGKDKASGGGGRDTLLGEGGKDKLNGQGGKDRLKGGPGKDKCTGGGGKDKATCEMEKKVP